jgi:CheY-like chemotaxis protein
MRRADVLLVEDSPYDAELTMSTIHGNYPGNHIEWVKDGPSALDFLFRRGVFKDRDTAHPRLVLLDLKLPGMDGMEVLRMIRNDPSLRQIPVVILTSSAQESDLLKSYELGSNSYVVKPVDFDRFAEEVGGLGAYWLLLNRTPRQQER